MKMQPKELYRRDSIGRCDPGHDIYSTVRNPNAPIPLKEIKPISMDKVESGPERLERQQLQKIRDGYIQIMNEDGSALKLMAVVGKIAFMTLILPPYFLFYGVPEFIINRLIPEFVKRGKQIIDRIPEWFSATTTWLVSQTQLLSALIKPFAIAKQNLEDFLKMMKDSTKAIGASMAHFFKETAKILALPFIKIAQISQDVGLGIKFVAEQIVSKLEELKDKIKDVIAFMEKGWNTAVATVMDIAQPVINWVAAQYDFSTQVVKQSAQWLGHTAHRAVEKVKEKLMPPIEKTVEIVKDMAEWTSNVAYMAAKPIIDWASPKFQAGKSNVRKISKAIKEKTKEVTKAIVDLSSQAVNHAKLAALALVNPFIDVTKLSINMLVTAPTQRLFKKGKEWTRNFKGKAQGVAHAVKEGIRHMRQSIQNAVKRQVGKVWKWIKSTLKAAWIYTKTIPAKMLQVAYAFGRLLMNMVKKTWAFACGFVHWSRILFKFGVQLVRELKLEMN